MCSAMSWDTVIIASIAAISIIDTQSLYSFLYKIASTCFSSYVMNSFLGLILYSADFATNNCQL